MFGRRSASFVDSISVNKMARASKRRVDILIGRSLITAEAIARELRERLADVLEDARARGVPIPNMLQLAREVLADFEPVLAQRVADSQLSAWILGAHEVDKRLPGAVIDQLTSGRGQLPPTVVRSPDLSDRLGHIRLPVIDKAVKDLHTRRVMTRSRFDQLDEAMKRHAFTIARIDSERTIGRMRDLLEQTVAEGASLTGFRDRVVENLGSSPIGASHLELVYRNGVQSSFRGGHETVLKHPIVAEVFPYASYTAIDDGRTREEHLELMKLGIDGTNIYRTVDPFWDYFTSPWAHNCRCGKSPMTVRQAAKRGLEEAKTWLRTGQAPPLVSRLPDIPFRPEPGFAPGGRFVA